MPYMQTDAAPLVKSYACIFSKLNVKKVVLIPSQLANPAYRYWKAQLVKFA